MCNRLRSGRTILTPGQVSSYRSMQGQNRVGTWGYTGSDGQIINARFESLDGFWKPMYNNGRDIITVDSFTEKNREFVPVAGGNLRLAVLHDPEGHFVIVTSISISPVNRVHARMPLIIVDQHLWLNEGKIASFAKLPALKAA